MPTNELVTIATITYDQILGLLREATASNNWRLKSSCHDALEGSIVDRAVCVKAFNAKVDVSGDDLVTYSVGF